VSKSRRNKAKRNNKMLRIKEVLVSIRAYALGYQNNH